MKTKKLIKILSVLIVTYALGIKFTPEIMPFNSNSEKEGLYEPHSSCFQDPEF